MSCVQDTLLTMTPLSFNEMNEIALVSQQLPLIVKVISLKILLSSMKRFLKQLNIRYTIRLSLVNRC